ncbi:hypothetical protein BWU74_27445 [Paraburkholderia caledonica]|nr:hypothetical protein BWU74_27445 [Burkholderia sp. Bk]
MFARAGCGTPFLRNAARRKANDDRVEGNGMLRERRASLPANRARRETKPREIPYENIRCLMYIWSSDE